MPKMAVMEATENAIRSHLGSLDDLPKELANTVANIYYRYFEFGMDMMARSEDNPGWLPRQVHQDGLLEGTQRFIHDSAKFMADVETIPDQINNLRQISRTTQPNLYGALVDLLLDCYKYEIPDAHKKIGLRRMIERKLRKDKVSEIPNLIDLLDI